MKKTISLICFLCFIATIFYADSPVSTNIDCKQVFRVIHSNNAVCNADVYVYEMNSTEAIGYGQTEDSECLFPSDGGVTLVSGNKYRIAAYWWQGVYEYSGVDTLKACKTGTFDITVQ